MFKGVQGDRVQEDRHHLIKHFLADGGSGAKGCCLLLAGCRDGNCAFLAGHAEGPFEHGAQEHGTTTLYIVR